MGKQNETREERLSRLVAIGGWIAVDFDGTIAEYTHWKGPAHLGEPIPLMVERVKRWLEKGIQVRIMTARAEDPEAVHLIQTWCKFHIGQSLDVTNQKDFQMIEQWDDRAVQVIPNTGRRADGSEEE